MIEPRLILCGGVHVPRNDPLQEGRHVVELLTYGRNQNVNLHVEDVAKAFYKRLTPRLKDLLEIAAYIYTADCATKRGGNWADEDTTEPWPRDFLVVVPVREPDFWSNSEVRDLLRETVEFLSSDTWQFEFRQLTRSKSEQRYFAFRDEEEWPFYDVDRVSMFSGGLDSLAGAVQRATERKNLVLVSHRPVTTQSKRQRDLFDAMQKAFSVAMFHVPVWINKEASMGREHTQRTRSFLYSALGTIVADSVRAAGVTFFENGIVSLNLPVADEALRARASRTTHPMSLDYFRRLYSLVLDRSFVVDNPFLFHTKTEVVSTIAESGAGQLIGLTCSCSHQGIFSSRVQLHCGACSQCIDRRIAIVAAGLEQFDPETDYRTDVFTGPRSEIYERNMAVNFARHGMELSRMSEDEMTRKFNLELGRAVRPFPNKSEIARQFVLLHQRHGQAVARVMEQQLHSHARHLAACRLDETSMLAMVAGQKHGTSNWVTYADRITGLLQQGLPRACKSRKPNNEPELQEISDGILNAHDNDLVREFPYLRWGGVSAKPDWSADVVGLLVEMKYVRTKKNIGPISEAISSDITKYGDNEQRVLYVVYDPNHLITDDRAFSKPVQQRPAMMMRFVR